MYLRAAYFLRIKRALRTLESEKAVEATLHHNLRSLLGVNSRTNLLFYPLAAIELVNERSEILIIGPRNEYDIFTLSSLGFPRKHIHALDLISYSPLVQLGDMHSMPYADASFDAVICGWTLSYSADPARAAAEICRVTKPGGVVAIAVEYSEMTPDDELRLVRYTIGARDRRRVNSTDDIRALFEEQIQHVYFDHNAPRRRSHRGSGLIDNVSNVALIFSLRSTTLEPEATFEAG